MMSGHVRQVIQIGQDNGHPHGKLYGIRHASMGLATHLQNSIRLPTCGGLGDRPAHAILTDLAKNANMVLE